MTDHKIVRRPGLAAPTAMLEEIDVPIDMPIRRYSFNANSTIPTDQEKVYELFIRLVDDDDSAVELLAKVLADSPADFSIPRYQLMQKWLGDGKFDAAAKLLKSLEGPFADFFAFHTNYAAQKIGTDRFDEVSRHLNRAMEIDPEQPAAWYHLGLFESKRPDADQAKNSQSAIASFQRAIELRPTYTKARIKLGHLYATQDRLELAAEQFLWAVNFDVGNVEATTSLAAVYRRLGHWNLATATLLDGLAIRPHQTKLLRAASILLLSPENALTPPAREGLSFANRWRDAAPDDVDAQLVLALALLKNGDFRESLQIAADVGLGDRRRPEAGLIMAACQKQLGLQSPTGAKGTLAAAEKNYTGALQAIDAAPIDQIGDLIRSIAVQAYGSNLTDQNSN
jgi:tetratricopeptide (TPR) repeat protein